MANQVFVLLLVSFLILFLTLLWCLGWLSLQPFPPQAGKRRTLVHRLLKPRTPLDCPGCRLASPEVKPASAPVRPWCEVKSRRGAPKRIPTAGFACPNPQCPYFGITDASIHALVGDGKHGQAERIQTFRGPACLTTFSARHDTPLYRLKTPSHQIATVLAALAEGLDPSAAERVFGSRQATMTTWLTRAGEHAQSLHAHTFRNLWLPHLQLDELRTRLRSCKHVLWLWLAIDPLTKLLPVLELGPRTQHTAHALIHALQQSLAPGCIPLFTSDGLNLYFYALTAHFGQWLEVAQRGRNVHRWQVATGLIYGQVKKCYQRRKLVQVTHVMRLGTQAVLQSTLQGLGFSGRLNTAFIERVNLTVRHGVAALARRTWATSQQSPYLLAHLEWWRAYYHGCRAPIPRCGWRSYSRENEEASEWRNAIGIVLLRWQREEPTDDGQRTKCSLAPSLRFPLERHRSQMGVRGHNGGRWVHVLGVELGWSLTPRSGDLPGLPHHNKPAQNGFGEGSSN